MFRPTMHLGDPSAVRRALLFSVGIGCVPLAAAQRPARIALLWLGEANPPKVIGPLCAELGRLGLTPGANLNVDWRLASQISTLDANVAELIALKPDLIVSFGGTVGVLALKRTNTDIPVVAYLLSDPVGKGLVQSLAHPGGSLTGNAFFATPLDLKRYQLLTEVVGPSAHIAVFDMNFPDDKKQAYLDLQQSGSGPRPARAVQFIQVREAADLESAFERIGQPGKDRVDAVAINQFPIASANEARIAALVAKYRLPAIADGRPFVEAGLLLSYTTDLGEISRRTASFIAKILSGARPADLPMELSSRFELIVNMKAAKALGLRMPPAVLARADSVIE